LIVAAIKSDYVYAYTVIPAVLNEAPLIPSRAAHRRFNPNGDKSVNALP
jgi:hypothetical protein